MSTYSNWLIEDNFGLPIAGFTATRREAYRRLETAVRDCIDEGDLPYHLSEEIQGEWIHDSSEGGRIGD